MSWLGGFFGLGDIASSIYGNTLNYQSALITNSQARRLARENRAWQEHMANTAHQREVRDLRQAGLNPILSATGGSGAATPSADTSASLTTPHFDFGSPGSSILKTISAAKQMENTDANTELQKANAAQANSATALNKAKTATESFQSLIKSIQSKFEAEKQMYGVKRAKVGYYHDIALADRQMADTLFRLSPLGGRLFAAKQFSDAYPGVVSGKLGGMLGAKFAKLGGNISGSIPAYLLRDSSGNDYNYLNKFWPSESREVWKPMTVRLRRK